MLEIGKSLDRHHRKKNESENISKKNKNIFMPQKRLNEAIVEEASAANIKSIERYRVLQNGFVISTNIRLAIL